MDKMFWENEEYVDVQVDKLITDMAMDKGFI